LTWTDRGEMAIGGVAVEELAERYGTPLYVVDVATLTARLRAWPRVMPPGGRLYYAGKAFLCGAMAQLVHAYGWGLDVVSGGELYTALKAGMDPDRIALHGNVKTPAEIRLAVESGVGRIVIDGLDEIPRLAAQAERAGRRQAVLVRLTPDVDADTHAYINTGHHDTKFGLALADGTAEEGLRRVLATPWLELKGYHAHIGSQIASVEPYRVAARRIMHWARAMAGAYDYWPEELDLGGGMAVPYMPGDPALELETVVAALTEEMAAGTPDGLPRPKLLLEPGRALVAPAGVTVYRVTGKKRVPSGRTFVMVDGGMGDNIRPQLYQARYSVWPARKPVRPPERVTVAGRYCETGDVLANDVDLAVEPGDLVVLLTTGAYHYAMASNYNRVPRPPVVAVEQGTALEWVQGETWDDLVRLDRPLARVAGPIDG
jgi:diaminopimelate decarboxylase